MEAFSNKHSTFLLDSIFLPNTPITFSALLGGGDFNTSFSYCPSEPLQEIPFDAKIQENSCPDNTTMSLSSDNEPSVTENEKKHKIDASSMGPHKLDSGVPVNHKEIPIEKKRKKKDGSCLSSAKSQEAQAKKQKKSSVGKETEEKKSKANKKNKINVPEAAETCYIHVRARRGEATDSHSLAERVRREKITVRMKLLQSLVPGCDKVSGKAHMLDEIINYVQSLQYQVEFLSMKLASMDPMPNEFAAGFDTFMVKSEKLSSLVSPLPSMTMHQYSPTQPIDFADTATNLATGINSTLLDNSVSFSYHRGQRLSAFSQANEYLSRDMDDQRQKFVSQCGFNNLCSFH